MLEKDKPYLIALTILKKMAIFFSEELICNLYFKLYYMKKILATFVFFALSFGTVLKAQTEADNMKAWQTYMTPGDIHKMLAKSNGNWNLKVTMWMDPKAPPMVSKATAHNEMIMGGRYQQSKTKGTMMGKPFEGMGLVGYDNAKKVLVSTWIDNMGTGVMTLEGKLEDKMVNFSGKCVDPITGQDMDVRETMQFIDDNTQKMEMFMTKDGNEFKTMEIMFTRAAAPVKK